MGNIYFVSDLHLGLHPVEKSRQRERKFVQWLDEIKQDAEALYLLGDIFDYWFEYRKVVPRGFVRTLGKLAELSDRGIDIHFFTGNHDVWVFDYLPSEIGLTVHNGPLITVLKGKRFYIAHGDGLGPGDPGYKLLKAIFHSKVLQWFYARIHPNASTAFAHWWSKKSRYSKGVSEAFQGEEKEEQIVFARKILEREHFDYFVFGHRHVAIDINLNGTSRLINLGEWIFGSSYAVFDGEVCLLKEYQPDF
ncbi:MAG: UDP-2,3-diacylglucosamine diphosphatase [Bacteroidales bacterium]|nr:UDP-2,3-diacylglucosamine diphosphatase [Bacteroidales bacterium]